MRKQKKITDLTQQMKDKGYSEDEIKKAVKTDVIDVCNQLKMTIRSSKKLRVLPEKFLTEAAAIPIEQFLNAFRRAINLKKTQSVTTQRPIRKNTCKNM